MNQPPTQDALMDDPEVPFVCTGCTRVFRARLRDLEGASIRCGSCGRPRSGKALLGLLPGYMRRSATRAT